MAGLVAVYVASDEAVGCDVFVVDIVFLGQIHGEQGIELVEEMFFSAHALDESEGVVRNMEGVVPCVSLYESFAIGLIGVEVGFKGGIAMAWAGKAFAGVEGVAVVECPRCECLGDVGAARCFCGMVDAQVVV